MYKQKCIEDDYVSIRSFIYFLTIDVRGGFKIVESKSSLTLKEFWTTDILGTIK